MKYTTRITVMFFAMTMFILSSSHDFHSHDSLVEEHYEFQCDLCLIGELDDVEILESIKQVFFAESVFTENRQPIITQTYRFFKSRAPPVTKV